MDDHPDDHPDILPDGTTGGTSDATSDVAQDGKPDGTSAVDAPSLPWTHRLGPFGKAVVTLLAGAAVAVIGTLAHRMGAVSNIPYGLVLAFLVLALSTWCARSRLGAVGVALHLIVSSLTAWGIAVGASQGDALIVAGFGGTAMPFFSQHAGYIWLYGMILVQVGMLMLPARWFRIPERRGSEPHQ